MRSSRIFFFEIIWNNSLQVQSFVQPTVFASEPVGEPEEPDYVHRGRAPLPKPADDSSESGRGPALDQFYQQKCYRLSHYYEEL